MIRAQPSARWVEGDDVVVPTELNRRGVIFVQSNEARLEALVVRVAECSRALFEELLERE